MKSFKQMFNISSAVSADINLIFRIEKDIVITASILRYNIKKRIAEAIRFFFDNMFNYSADFDFSKHAEQRTPLSLVGSKGTLASPPHSLQTAV